MNLLVSDALAAESSVPLAGVKVKATATAATMLATEDDTYNVSPEKMLMDNLMILGLLFFVFYFMLIRPQQRRVKAHQKMVGELAKGKKVITAGGLIGTIAKFEGDDVVVVEIAPDVKVRVARSSISDVVDNVSGKAAKTSDKKKANDN